MRSFPTILLLLALRTAVDAQPVITSASAPVPGMALSYANSSTYPELPAGEDQVWYLPGPYLFPAPWQFVQPMAVPWENDFPDATVAIVLGGIMANFYVLTKTELYETGTSYWDGDVRDLIDMQLEMVFPCTYGTSWTDSSSVAYTPGGPVEYFYAPTTWTADGFGTVISEGGQLSNVLKLHGVQSSEFHADGNHQQDTVILDRFWHPDHPYYVAHARRHRRWWNGQLVVDNKGVYVLADLALGTGQVVRPSSGFRLQPNPASEQVTVVCALPDAATLSICNGVGREVYRSVLAGPIAGTRNEQIDLSAFAPGCYTVRLTIANGAVCVEKLMVQH